MTVLEALLIWFGLNKNTALDLGRKAESPQVTRLVERQELVSGSVMWDKWPQHTTASSNEKESAMLSGFAFKHKVCIKTRDSGRPCNVVAGKVITATNPFGSAVSLLTTCVPCIITLSPLSFRILICKTGKK